MRRPIESGPSGPLARFSGMRVIVVGIGGGGDIVGALPAVLALRRAGAVPVAAGLTWKRRLHDPANRPRRIGEFRNAEPLHAFAARVNAATETVDGIRHIESHVAALLPDIPVLAIDPTPGVAGVRDALRSILRDLPADAVAGIDVGGDVLAPRGSPLVESPLCDQILLAALAELSDSVLGVFGFGSDGELALEDFLGRFEGLVAADGFLGGVPIHDDDLPILKSVLVDAKTESSRLPVEIAAALDREDRQRIARALEEPSALRHRLGAVRRVPLRGGARTGELSALSAFTLYFDPAVVYVSGGYKGLIDESATAFALHQRFLQDGIRTELTSGTS